MTRLSVCRVALTGAALFLTACGGQNIALREPVIPPPLMEQLNYRVAVQYSKEMYDYTHKEELLGNKKWTISLGEANKRVYDQLFSALFSDVTYLSPDENINGREFDLVMRPSIQAFEFALPQQSRTDAYTVWIRYQIELFNRFGSKIGTWPINAYGKSGAGRFEGSEAIQRAAALAMRDAAALVSMRLSAQAKNCLTAASVARTIRH